MAISGISSVRNTVKRTFLVHPNGKPAGTEYVLSTSGASAECLRRFLVHPDGQPAEIEYFTKTSEFFSNLKNKIV